MPLTGARTNGAFPTLAIFCAQVKARWRLEGNLICGGGVDSRAGFLSLARMIIAPSLLAADFGEFAYEARRIEKAGADWLHLDIMDGHFVPNISFGPQVVKVVRNVTKLPLDVHLMCSRPEILLEP